MKGIILRGILVLAIVGLFVAGQAWYFSGKSYQSPTEARPSLSDISVAAAPAGSFEETTEAKKGVILLDRAHRNSFAPGEMDVLTARLTSNGYAVEQVARAADLREKLHYADAAVLISPQTAFSDADGKLLQAFVRKGGKLLLMGKPTRVSEINGVASRFGLLFEPDYLYNLKENDGNFKNIFITNFRDSDITNNLKKIAFYAAGSITSSDQGIAFGDANTYSSVRETKGRLSPMVLTGDSRVLAIAELTFMAEPYNSVLDNNQLVINIAAWLMNSQRSYDISDYPYFFKDRIGVAYTEASFLDRAVTVKNLLVEQGKTVEVGEYKKGTWANRDLVLLGSLRDVSQVEDLLKTAGISVTVTPKEEPKPTPEPTPTATPTPAPTPARPEGTPSPTPTATPTPTPTRTPTPTPAKPDAEEPEEKPVNIKVDISNMGQVYQKEGTAIFYLYRGDGRYVLIVLSDTKDIMKQSVDLLGNGRFRQYLASDKLGVLHFNKDGVVEPPPRPEPTPMPMPTPTPTPSRTSRG